ncbi:MAG: DUF58 domain-containing protein [Treponema sp.]|jgi:uncharacterized protein (DUF58 family)|nr:DUF58 domain-containing protein [Treponema sp.]
MTPGRTLFCVLLGFLGLGAAAFFYEPLLTVSLFAALFLLPLVIADALALVLFTDRLTVKRELAGGGSGNICVLGRRVMVRLIVSRGADNGRNADGGGADDGGGSGPARPFLARSIRLFDIYPDALAAEIHEGRNAFPVKLDRRLLRLPGSAGKAPGRRPRSASLVFEYPAIPLDRGEWEFPRTELLLGSPLGLWRLKAVHPCVSRGRTFPDFRKLASGADLRGVLEQTGIKVIRKRGQGMEFMSLREYQRGDSVKAIDWRATGRRRKTIVREYQEEQDQQVLLLLDSGYRLHRLEEGPAPGPAAHGGTAAYPGAAAHGGMAAARTQFDSALEASLLLSWVALKHGDAVALGCFGAEERWLPPRKGMGALAALTRSLYDVKSAPAPSSLFSALDQALGRLKRRSFIIMVSNFREEDGESLSWVLRRIGRRHLLLLVSLKESEAEVLAKRRPAGGDEALESAAAFAYLSERRRLYKTWEHQGLLTLECSSRELSAHLINRYLEVKRSGLL